MGECVWGNRSEQTRKLDHTSEMTDDNKPFLQTYLKYPQTAAVTMFGTRQFNRKRGGDAEVHKRYLVPPTLPSHLGDGEREREGRGSGRGGRVLVSERLRWEKAGGPSCFVPRKWFQSLNVLKIKSPPKDLLWTFPPAIILATRGLRSQ